MKNNYKLIAIFIFFVPTIHAVCDETTKKEIAKTITAPYKIYINFQAKFVPVMSVDAAGFFKKAFDAWPQWRDFTDCANSFVKADRYQPHLENLNKAKDLISNIIKGNLTNKEVINKELASSKVNMNEAFRFALDEINEAGRPDSWKKDVMLSSPEKILPGYKQFFKDYGVLGQRFVHVVDFLVEKKKVSQDKDVKSISDFADDLEKLVYLFEEEMKKSGWRLFGTSKSDLQSMISKSTLIIEELLYDYPSIITSLMAQKYYTTKNFAALVILTQAEQLHALIKKIQDSMKK
jgi:hypothetical protein